MKRLISSAIAALLLGATSSAFAYDGFATGNVNLRAGPDIDYPVVTTVPAGDELAVQGCTDGWEWCDVVYGDARGWVAGNYIQYEYNDQPVLLSGYGAAIGVPIVGFVIADYWGHYYRNRPFWVEHDRWYARPYIRRAPPPAFRGPVHDWGHDHAHFGGDHGHGYSGHGPENHGGSHGGPEFHGGSHGGPENHGGPHAGPENHGAPHGGPENHGASQVSHGGPQNHGPQPQGHNGPQQQGHNGPQPQGHSGGPAQHGPSPQGHAAPAAQHAAPQHSAPAASHDKGSHDKDHH
jgi:uncharacterized protein YraI